MFTVIYIEFFSLHCIDLKLTTLFIYGTFRDWPESPRVTWNENVVINVLKLILSFILCKRQIVGV